MAGIERDDQKGRLHKTRTVRPKHTPVAPVLMPDSLAGRSPITPQTVRPVRPAGPVQYAGPSLAPVVKPSTVKRYAPKFNGEPEAGRETGFIGPDGHFYPAGTRAPRGSRIGSRPVYTDEHTHHAIGTKAVDPIKLSAEHGIDPIATAPGVYRDSRAVRDVRRAAQIGVSMTGMPAVANDLSAHKHAAAAANIAAMLPWFRGTRALIEGARALRAGEEFGAAARASMQSPGPIANALKTRVFKVNSLDVHVPAAGSGLGRAMEGAADAARPVTSKAGLKSELERAGSEYVVTHRNNMKTLTNAATTLRKVGRHLNDAQQYALRIVGEGIPPEERAAFHAGLAGTAEVPAERAYHGIHAALIQKAARYIELDANGVPQIASNAPNHLKLAHELMQEVASQRESLYADMGMLQDSQIADRINAPGRVIRGARYLDDEKLIQQYLDGNESRQKLIAALRSHHQGDEAAVNAALHITDSMARVHANDVVGDPMAVDEFYNKLADVHTHNTLGPNEVPESVNMLYQDAPPTPSAALPDSLNYARIARGVIRSGHPLPDEIATPAKLRTAIRNVYDLAKAGADYRDWYDRAAVQIKRAAANEGIEPGQMAQLTAVYSQSANPMANMSFAVRAVREWKQLGRIESLGAGGKAQREKAQRILEGHPWEGRKTNSFYSNIAHSVDPADSARLGLDPGAVTVDRWVIRMFAPQIGEKGVVPKKLYNGIEHMVQQMADELGWSPKELQAAAWVTAKARGLAERYPKRPMETNWSMAGDAYEQGVLKHSDQASLFDAHAGVAPEDRVGDNVDSIGAAVEAAREPDGGFTLTKTLKPDAGADGHVVALGAYEDRVKASDLTPEKLLAYRNAHLDVLNSDPTLRVGGWHNPADGNVYLDISKVVGSRDEALALAKQEGQLSVFDRAAGARGEWDTAFPESGLTAEQADAIKAGKKAAVRYDALIANAARKSGIEGKLTQADRQGVEEWLHHWADKNPNDPYAQQFKELAHQAQQGRNSPDPSLLFQRMPQSSHYYRDQFPRAYAKYLGHGQHVDEAQVGEIVKTALAQGDVKTANMGLQFLHESAVGPGGAGGPRVLYQGVDDFGDAAAQELANYRALARDIKATLPEEEWPRWVRNQDKPPVNPVGDLPEPQRAALTRLPDETDAEFASRQAAVEQDYMIRHKAWQDANSFPEDWLGQRHSMYHDPLSGEVMGGLDYASAYGYKGAISFGPEGATLHLTEHSDTSTFLHEMAHFARRYMVTENMPGYRALLRHLGVATDSEGRAAAWTVQQEEQFARMFESWVRDGRGPKNLTRPLQVLSNRLKAIYEHSDLPDVPPGIAHMFEHMTSPRKVRGGRLVGAEDFTVGVNYIPYVRGVPQSMSAPIRSTGAYFRRAQDALFGGGGRSAIGAGPQDKALKKAYKGNLLLHGSFTIDVTNATADSLMVAAKVASARTARRDLLKASTDIPTHPNDVAIKVDPKIAAPKELQAFWDKLKGLDDEGKLDHRALDGIDLASANAITESMFPSHIEGTSIQDLATHAIEHNEPIDNIRWIPREFLDKTLLAAPMSAKNAHMDSLNKGMRALATGGRISVDMMNDVAKAILLYLNPAYGPVNLAGNLVMNAMHQGVFMPINAWRAVMLHRTLNVRERVMLDNLMGHGLVGSIRPSDLTPGALAHATLGRVLNLLVDFIPRRMAFLHEARKAGFEGKNLKLLLDDRNHTEEMLRIRDYVARKANDAIVDYDRMTPMERNVINRVIFFYPWVKGATRYANRFIVEHPYQTMALLVMGDHAKAQADQSLGDRPNFLEETFPISTDVLGAKIPLTGFDTSLSDAVGHHEYRDAAGHPMVLNVRQAFTQTTPMEMLSSLIAFAGSDPSGAGELASNLTPVPYAAGVAMFGRDPFKRKDVPQGFKTFGKQLIGKPPIAQDIQRIRMTPEERAKRNEHALYPRTKGNEILHMPLGGLTPSPLNTVTAAGLAASVSGDQYKQELVALKESAKQAGINPPPPVVTEELKLKVKLSQSLKPGSSYQEKLLAASKLYDSIHGTNYTRDAKGITAEDEARRYYYQVRDGLFGNLNQYRDYVRQNTDPRQAK